MIYKRHTILTETNEVRFYFNNEEFHAIRYNRYSVLRHLVTLRIYFMIMIYRNEKINVKYFILK